MEIRATQRLNQRANFAPVQAFSWSKVNPSARTFNLTCKSSIKAHVNPETHIQNSITKDLKLTNPKNVLPKL